MKIRNCSFLDTALWVLAACLMLYIPRIEMRVEESEQPREAPREQPPHATTVKPEPIEQHLNLGKCLHLSREHCPPPRDGCRTVGEAALFCCDIDSAYYRDVLGQNLTQHKTKYLHVLNGSIEDLDVSQAMFRRLASMAFTDGKIGQIVEEKFEADYDDFKLESDYDDFKEETESDDDDFKEESESDEDDFSRFPKYSAVACLNISHNNLTSRKLPSKQRPFAYLFNLTVLDASANNLTEFPLSLVHSNRKISVDLSGNNWLPCKHFQKAMETNNNTLVTFLNYNDTYCALDLSFNWFNDVEIVKIDYLRVQKELNASCRNIMPPDINCTCVPELVEVIAGDVTRLVAVDCSARNLTEMPTNLPPNTVKLNVSYNNITSLQPVSDDPTYDHLRRLILDHNDIPNILELEGTKFIDNFMLLSITHNQLKTIHTYVLSNRFDTTGPGFMIAGNHIHCDCNTEKMLKPWLLEKAKNIPDYRHLLCQGMGAVVDLIESHVCHTPRDWTDYIYYIIALEVLILVLLVSKVSYDYWVFKTAGYLPWPANKMPRLPCDWLCE